MSFQPDMRLPDCRPGSSCSLSDLGPGPEQQLSRAAEWVPAEADRESPGQLKQSPDFRGFCFKVTSALFSDFFWVLGPNGKRGGREEGLELGTDHLAARQAIRAASLLTAPDPPGPTDTQGIRMRHWCYLGTATLVLTPNTGWREERGASFKESLGWGLEAGGRHNPCWLAPRRPEFGSRATSSSLDVLSQAADPASLKSLRGLCLQVRPTTRSPHTHTHSLTPTHALTHAHSSTHTVTHTQSHRHAHRHSCTLTHTLTHRQQARSGAPNKGGGVGGRWQPRAGGEGLRLGRDVAQSLTGHQQPQHLLFLTSKGNRFVSD